MTYKEVSQPSVISSIRSSNRMMNSQNPQDDLYKNIHEDSKIVVTDLTGDVGLFEPFKP